MSQPQTAQANQSASAPKERTYRIRMKPGCGKMLIGRKWETRTGAIVDELPVHAEDRMNPIDEWLLDREVDAQGEPGPGPIATVPESAIKRFLNSAGVPTRVVEGYGMVKMHGDTAADRTGELSSSRPTFSPAANPGVFNDCAFEIVRD